MNLTLIILLAIGLSMDSFAVALANGFRIKEKNLPLYLKISLSFGFFQALFVFLGWFFGTGIGFLISGIDHWIAFILLSIIGGKMIYESSISIESKNLINTKAILSQSVATSIDAFIVGISLSLLKTTILTSSVIVGLTTIVFSFLGIITGKKAGKFLKEKAEFFGGLMIIGIGVKILLSHLL